MGTAIKHYPRKVALTKNPVFIVGECPGRSKQTGTQYAWIGNRSANLLNELIESCGNLYLTNVFNYLVDYEFDDETPIVKQGLKELEEDIKRLKPSKVVCLGHFAYRNVIKNVDKFGLEWKQVVMLFHPSYIARFNKDRVAYKQKLLEAINKEKT